MAVVTRYGSAAYDPATQPRVPLNSQLTAGKLMNLVSTLEIVATDSSTSVYNMGRIPSSAVIKRSSRIYADANAELTDVDVGIAKSGTAKDADCLLDGWDGHLGGVSNLIGIDYADLGKPAWELAGWTSDPGGDIEVIVTLKSNMGHVGTITLDLDFQMP